MKESKAKVSCFAYTNNHGHEVCKVLTDMQCKKGECRFYKPDHEVDMNQIERDIRNYSTYKK